LRTVLLLCEMRGLHLCSSTRLGHGLLSPLHARIQTRYTEPAIRPIDRSCRSCPFAKRVEDRNPWLLPGFARPAVQRSPGRYRTRHHRCPGCLRFRSTPKMRAICTAKRSVRFWHFHRVGKEQGGCNRRAHQECRRLFPLSKSINGKEYPIGNETNLRYPLSVGKEARKPTHHKRHRGHKDEIRRIH
jgi:hypothetical protein